MTCTIRTEADGRMTIITAAGNVARMTDNQPFISSDAALALMADGWAVAPGRAGVNVASTWV